MIVVNPTSGLEIKDSSFNPFVDKVIRYLYDNHNADFCKIISLSKVNLAIDYGKGIIGSVFYHNPTGAHKTHPYPYSFPTIHGTYYLCRDWQIKPRPNNADFDHLKEMVNTVFPMYDIIDVGGEFQLVTSSGAASSSTPSHARSTATMSHTPKHSTDVNPIADNLIRVDYSYLKSLSPTAGAVPANFFDVTSTLLASFGEVSFMSLMDRVPVYVVDEDFMQKYFAEKISRIQYALMRLQKILYLLQQIQELLLRSNNVDRHKIKKLASNIREIVEEVFAALEPEVIFDKAPYLGIYFAIREFIYSLLSAIEWDFNVLDYLEWVERLIADIKEILQAHLHYPSEALGVYCSNWNNGVNYEKAIFICWERINECAGRDARDLLTKVTIHEFCHAYMDIIADSGTSYGPSDPTNVCYWMEESMANVMTLKIIEKYIIKKHHRAYLLDYVKSFMQRQPDAYAIATQMFKNGICDYDLWAWNKEKCIALPSVQKWVSDLAAKTVTDSDMRKMWNDIKKDVLA